MEESFSITQYNYPKFVSFYKEINLFINSSPLFALDPILLWGAKNYA